MSNPQCSWAAHNFHEQPTTFMSSLQLSWAANNTHEQPTTLMSSPQLSWAAHNSHEQFTTFMSSKQLSWTAHNTLEQSSGATVFAVDGSAPWWSGVWACLTANTGPHINAPSLAWPSRPHSKNWSHTTTPSPALLSRPHSQHWSHHQAPPHWTCLMANTGPLTSAPSPASLSLPHSQHWSPHNYANFSNALYFLCIMYEIVEFCKKILLWLWSKTQ